METLYIYRGENYAALLAMKEASAVQGRARRTEQNPDSPRSLLVICASVPPERIDPQSPPAFANQVRQPASATVIDPYPPSSSEEQGRIPRSRDRGKHRSGLVSSSIAFQGVSVSRNCGAKRDIRNCVSTSMKVLNPIWPGFRHYRPKRDHTQLWVNRVPDGS